MKIAIASQNQRKVTAHAGQCRKFWIYETNDAGVADKRLLELAVAQSFHDTAPHQPPGFDEVQVLIAQGMCEGFVQRLQRYGIEGIVTSETDPDQVIAAYLDGSLVRGVPEVHDEHHGHHHGHSHRHGHSHHHHEHHHHESTH
jgi:predicted Fe-Mo cluster-binding NifX family protein